MLQKKLVVIPRITVTFSGTSTLRVAYPSQMIPSQGLRDSVPSKLAFLGGGGQLISDAVHDCHLGPCLCLLMLESLLSSAAVSLQ